MAKKKKGGGGGAAPKRDARGYGQQHQPPQAAPPSSSSGVSTLKVTTATQNHLDQVLVSMEHHDLSNAASAVVGNGSGNAGVAAAVGPSDRFVKRLSNVYDRLKEATFTDDQIERAVAALGYSVTLEGALDYLCFHLSTSELPPLFTEGSVRDDLASTSTSTSLRVIVPQTSTLESNSNGNDESGDDGLSSPLPVTTLAGEGDVPKGTEEEAAPVGGSDGGDDAWDPSTVANNNKEWILRQYGDYCSDNDDDNDENIPEQPERCDIGGDAAATAADVSHAEIDGSEACSRAPAGAPFALGEDGAKDATGEGCESDGTPRPETGQTSAAEPLVVSVAEEEEEGEEEEDDPALRALRAELEQVQADVNDEASNYLRSKHEIRDLRKKCQQLQKGVAGMERAVAKARKARTKPMEHGDRINVVDSPSPNEDEEDDEVGAMLGLFDEDTPTTAAVKEPSIASEPVVRPPSMDFPEDALKSWTGKTPRQLLHEYCSSKKHGVWSQPKYALQGDKCTVTVKPAKGNNRPTMHAELVGSFRTSHDSVMAKEYVATKLLYKVQSDRPLYRVLPPYFADLWKEWRDAETKVEVDAKNQVKDERARNIQRLLDLVASTANAGSAVESEVDYVAGNSSGATDSGKDHPVVRHKNGEKRRVVAQVMDDTKLHRMFVERRKTPQYQKMLRERSALPIFSFRDRILECVRAHPVTVLSAETGAGKSTNCVQFLLEDAIEAGRFASILCTQPRRVAATSVAERVAEEMGEASVGTLVGYQIRLESRKGPDTRLLFCTTGVVLRRLVDDPNLSGVTHVIVDEVHERQWQIDVLLISLRKLLSGPRPDLKVVLMSATLDSKLFCSYFGGAPLVSVPGRTYPVSSYYLEDLLEETGHIIEEGSRFARRDRNWKDNETTLWVSSRGGEKRKETHTLLHERELSGDFEGYCIATQKSMDRVDESIINYDLIEDVLKTILLKPAHGWGVLRVPPGANLAKGSVLVFLPGLGEIKTLVERLNGTREFGRRDAFDIIPMHSSLSSTDQRRAFRVQPEGSLVRKIVVATNIAETSVTIPDVTYVIDAGRFREMHHDKRTSTPKLINTWCSTSSTKQRAGRAGRVQAGMCLKLFSSKTESQVMKDITEPEIMRVPLEEVCLNILATGLTKSCKSFLCLAAQPPPDSSVAVALDRLREIGAITVHETYESLTPLGRHLSQLPMDARLGKMLVYGALFKCVDPISTIAACLSAPRSVFASSFAETSQGSATQSKFCHQSSDFLTLVNVYDSFVKAEASGTAKTFCHYHSLNYATLQEARQAKALYVDLLCSIGLLESKEVGTKTNGRRLDFTHLRTSSCNANGSNEGLLNAVVLGGVYPNLARVSASKGINRACAPASLEQKTEKLQVHGSSVNHRLPSLLPSLWVAFGEKLGTSGKRISVSTTCFVSEMAILLLANDLKVKHFERKVIVDDWIEFSVPAQTAVTIQTIRSKLDRLLTSYFESHLGRFPGAVPSKVDSTVDSIVKLFVG